MPQAATDLRSYARLVTVRECTPPRPRLRGRTLSTHAGVCVATAAAEAGAPSWGAFEGRLLCDERGARAAGRGSGDTKCSRDSITPAMYREFLPTEPTVHVTLLLQSKTAIKFAARLGQHSGREHTCP